MAGPSGASRGRRPLAVAGGTLLALLLAGVGADRWYATVAVDRARGAALTQLHPYHEAVERAVRRRMATLAPLRAFLELGPPGTIRDDLDAFADGLHASIPGVRALQYVHDGIIRYTSRLYDNRAALGYDLLHAGRPTVAAGVRQALAADTAVLTGPYDLIQGGRGLVGRLATFPRNDPRFGLSCVVMDLEPIFAEAGLADAGDGMDHAVRDADGSVLFGDSTVFRRDPVTLPVELPGRRWELAAAPPQGWRQTGAPGWSVRGAIALVVILGTALAWAISSRERELRRAVSAHTDALFRANDELRAQHLLLHAVIEGSPDPILVKDRTGQYLLVNAAASQLMDRPAEAIIGRRPADLLPSEEAADIEATDRAVLEAREPFVRERRFSLPRGTRTLLLAVHPWVDVRGEVAGTVTVAHDLTDREELENQLRHAQKLDALGRLSGGIAHDFNNVLTAILANAHLLMLGLDEQHPELGAEAQAITSAAQRGAELTRKLLAFGRRDMLERRALNLRDIMAETATMARRLLPEHIEVEAELPDEPLVVDADPGALSQILLNLITNARDAMPVHGRLRMQLERATTPDGPVARFSVADSGLGMDAAIQARIFDPFFTTKPPGAGTGLGLSIAYGLVQQHDGTIRVDSRPGRGTSVIVELPLTATDPVTPAPARGARPTPSARAAETVLVVEDEDAIRDTVRRLLRRHGYRVLVASDGAEGLEVLRREPDVALVITDLVMPRMGGAELSQLARQAGVRAAFLYATGYPGVSGAPGGAPAPGAVIAKPWLPEDLLARVREVLDAHQAAPGAPTH